MSWKARLRSTAIVVLGGALVRALALTWRIHVIADRDAQELLASGAPMIYLPWHGDMLPLLWQHRNQGVAVLISEHRDGELVARLAHSLGFRTVRGSSTRGGDRALIGLIRELKDGARVAVTPDGPRGPRHSVATGALVASQRAGVPMLGIGVGTRRAWRLRSWDRFQIPKPFARVVICYTTPLRVQAERTRDVELEVDAIRDKLLDVVARARAESGAPDV